MRDSSTRPVTHALTRSLPSILLALAGALAAGAGCRDHDDAGTARKTAAPPPTAAPAAADADSTGGPVAAVEVAPELAREMRDHFAAAARVQQALVAGELASAHDEAGRLAAVADDPELAGSEAYAEAVRTAAAWVETAPDLDRAAPLVAELGGACASCHTARGAIVTVAWEPVPDVDGTIATRMRRHQWAAARLWEGLIAPSQDLWNVGAEVLADRELEGLMAERIPLDRPAHDQLGTVQRLAAQAPMANTPASQIELYGELMSTCVSCHRMVRDPGRAP